MVKILRTPALLSMVALAACGGADGPGPAVGAEAAGWPVAVETHAKPSFDRIVLVTLDTLRADHVSSYGYPRRTTPFLDSLAARGARFESAMATISHTAPSHASMLTGLVPAAHGVVFNGDRLDAGAMDLARLAGGLGYETAAFVNVGFLAGIAGAFGHVVPLVEETPGGNYTVLAGDHVVDAAQQWLGAERKSSRFLLWVHLYDPHKWKNLMQRAPTGPVWSGATPPDFLTTVARLHGLPETAPGEFEYDWKLNDETSRWYVSTEGGAAANFLRAIECYDTLIAYSDQQVKRLYEFVEGLGLPGRTLWIVTSDHGEGLAAHGVAGHGARIYQEQLRVPLIVHASDGSIPGASRRELVSHVDLFPTVAEALGQRTSGLSGVYEGRSLWPILAGEAPDWSARRVFAQRMPPGRAGQGEEADPEAGEASDLFALQDGTHKYLWHDPGEDEFFDLARDPLELHNLVGGGDPAEEALRTELEERLRYLRALTPAGEGEEMPEGWLEELRHLGYAR